MRKLSLLLFGLSLNFICSAQPTCDQISIVEVILEPIEMDHIIVHLVIDSEEFGFSYPGFRIYDQDDNLIGEEVVNFFGIIGESTHIVPHNLENVEPGQEYSLKLELWSGFYDTLECTFEETAVLIPEDDCAEISFTLSLQSFNGINENYILQVWDVDQNLAFEEYVTLTDSAGWTVVTACLDQGCYTYTVGTDDAAISQDVTTWLTSTDWFFPEGYMATAAPGDPVMSIDFGVWSDCLIDQIEPENPLELLIYPNPAREALNVVGLPAGSAWTLVNSGGQVVQSDTGQGRIEIDVHSLARGLYILNVNTGTSLHSYKIVR